MTTKKATKKPVIARRKPVQRKPRPQAPTLQTRIIFILDESGSMGPRTQMVIDGVNEYINRLKAENRKSLDLYRLSIYKFDTRYRGIYEEMPLAQVEPININHYNAASGGSTALLDAVGRALTVAGIGPNLKNLVIVNTDGYENASHEFSKERVAQLVREREDSGMWTFVYLGANIDAWAGAMSIGSHQHANAIQYDWSHHKGIYAGIASATTGFTNDATVTASPSLLQTYTNLDVDSLKDVTATQPITVDQKIDANAQGRIREKNKKRN